MILNCSVYAMRQVVEIKELPLLVNGKVDRQKLLQLYAKQRQQQRGECL